MIRRINYTGRKKILRADTRFIVSDGNGGPPTFRVMLDLDGYELPNEAHVYLEAYRQTSWQRYRAGTVGSLNNLGDHDLSEFGDTDGLNFRVRVTSPDGSRCLMLAEADKVAGSKPEDAEDGREPLLPVKGQDLGPELWRLDLSDTPLLLVNKRLNNWREAAKHPAFISLVYPAAFRHILFTLMEDDYAPDPDDPGTWQSRWYRFALLLPGVGPLPDKVTEEEKEDWVTNAVEALCRTTRVYERFDGFWHKEAGR